MLITHPIHSTSADCVIHGGSAGGCPASYLPRTHRAPMLSASARASRRQGGAAHSRMSKKYTATRKAAAKPYTPVKAVCFVRTVCPLEPYRTSK